MSILFGSNLMKSGRVTQLTIDAGQCFIMDFNEEQAARLGIRPSTIRSWTHNLQARRAEKPVIELDAPTFHGIGKLDPMKNLTGTVIIRGLDRLQDETFTLRLAIRDRDLNITKFANYPNKEGAGALPFAFKPAGDRMKESRPVVVCMDVCRVKTEAGKEPEIEVLSNTVAVVVDFAAPPESDEVPFPPAP
jgi:hypothetical protein